MLIKTEYTVIIKSKNVSTTVFLNLYILLFKKYKCDVCDVCDFA